MKYNKLGNTGLLVSELSFGSWVTFSKDGKVSEEQLAFDLMKTAYEGGVNFFDNAEVYSHGEAETIMGKAVAMGLEQEVWTREDLVLSTKIFFGALAPEGHKDFKPHRKKYNRIGLSRKHIIEGVKASLKRMNLDYLDLVYCHRFDPLANIEEIVRSFNFLIDQGLCYYWGTSEWSVDQILQAKRVADRFGLIGPVMEQPQYSMMKRDKIEVEYRSLYPELGTTTWSPLFNGILTGKYKDGIPPGSRLASDQFKDTREGQRMKVAIKKAEELRPVAEKLGCSLAQLALAWCLKNPNVSAVIGGATSQKQMKENLEAVNVVDKLTPEIMAEIDKILDNTPPLDFNTLMVNKIRGGDEVAHNL